MQDNQMKLRQVLSFSDTISLVFDVVREGFKPVMLNTLRLCGPWLVITSILAGYGMAMIMQVVLGIASVRGIENWSVPDDSFSLSNILWVVGLVVTFLLLYGIASTIQICVTYLSVKHYDRTGEFASYDLVKSETKRYFWRVLFGAILSAVMVNIAMQFFYLPGIFLSVPMAMMVAGMVSDDLDIGRAISRVFTLISGRWWFSFGILLVSGLAQVALAGIVSVPLVIVVMGVGALSYSDSLLQLLPTIAVVTSVLVIAMSTLTTYVSLTAHMVLYYTNSERTDGTKLASRVAEHFGIPPFTGEHA